VGDRRSTRFGRIWVLGAVGGLALSACGVDPAPSAESPQLGAVEIPAVDDGPRTASADDLATAAEAPTALSEQQALDQLAIWPAPDVVFATPEEAAADFVSSVLISEGDPVLGEFRQGDARSGEIAVLFAGETGDVDPPQELGLLFLRQIGPTDGWYVIGAVSDGAVIGSPATLAEVPAGTLNVSGEGRGFEGTLVVSAFPPGDAAAEFDREIGAGGAFEELQPYSVELDLSGARAGQVVVILVRGDTGLGSDPGTFAALPVVISSGPSAALPPTK
jgi:hypothetical protein